jgi:hypothetical protein
MRLGYILHKVRCHSILVWKLDLYYLFFMIVFNCSKTRAEIEMGGCKKHLLILLCSVTKEANFLEYYKIRKLIYKKMEK